MKTAFARFSAGEQAAAAEVIADYGPVAYAAALGVLRDEARAELIATDVLADALANPLDLGGFREAEALWIAAAARRRALALQQGGERRGRRRNEREETGLGPQDTAWEWLIDGLTAGRVCAALEELRPPLREAVTLSYISGLAPAALARRVGVSEERARERLRAGLIELQEYLLASAGAVSP
jgi:RNA polymerase sigma-70 factor (ECF subfamily)